MTITIVQQRCAALAAGLFLLAAASAVRAGDAPDPQRANIPLADVPPALTPPAPRSPALPPLPERTQRALAHAQELRGEGRYTEATLELEKALRRAPDDPRVERALARTLWEAGDAARVGAHARAALAGGDDDLVAHYLLGRLAERSFENAEALRQFRTALACPVPPEDRDIVPLAQYHLAETLAAEGYLAAAIAAYGQFAASAEALPVDAPVAAELAALRSAVPRTAPARISAVAAQLGDFNSAAEHLRDAFGENPMPPAERRKYAELLLAAGELDAALTEARAVVAADPAAVDLLAAVHTRRGTPEGVVADLRTLSAEHPDNAALTEALAGALQQAGQADEAVSVLRQRAASTEADAAVHWALFDTLVAQQDWTAVLTAAADAVAADVAAADEAERRMTALPQDACAALATGAGPAAPAAAGAYVRGVLAEACGRDDDAIAQYERAIAADAAFLPARLRLGNLQLARFAWEKAKEAAAPAGVELPEDARRELILGKACLGLSENDKAGDHFRSAIRLDHGNTAAMLALAELYRAQGELHRGMRLLQSLVDQDPANERARELLFSAYLADNDRRAAGRQVEELRRMSANPATIARCVAWLEFDEDNPDPERFQRTLEEGLSKSPAPDARTLHFLALAQMQRRQYADATATLERATALDPANREVAETLVGAYRATLDFEAALRQRRLLMERYPNQPWARSDEIELLLTLQRFDEALGLIRAWLAEGDVPAEQAENLRQVEVATLMQREDFPAAAEALEKRHQQKPGDAEILRRLILVHQRLGAHARALELIRLWPEEIVDGFAVSGLGAIWQNLPAEQHAEVTQLLLSALAKEPGSDALQVAVIELLTALGDYPGALEMAAANAESGRYADAFEEMRVDILNAAGRVSEAIAAVQARLVAQPADPRRLIYVPFELRERLVRLLVKDGRADQAIKELNRWLADVGQRLEARAQGQSGWPQPGQMIDGDLDLERQFYLGLLSYVQQETGDVPEALQTLQLILDADVTEAGPSNDLGYSLVDAGQDLDRAEKLVRYAVAKQPRNSAFLDSLGWLLYKRGDFGPAREWLTRARYAGEGEDPVVCDHLGDTCWRLGLKDEARGWWEESIRLAERTQKGLWPSPTHARTQARAQAKLAALAEGGEPQVAPVADGQSAGAAKPAGAGE